MLLRTALILALIAAAGYGVWEIRRWSLPETQGLITAKQKRLRSWGLFFLLGVLGLWLGGTYLPTPGNKHALVRWGLYYMMTIIASLPLVPLALLDWRENLMLLAENRRKLFQETIGPLSQRPDPPV